MFQSAKMNLFSLVHVFLDGWILAQWFRVKLCQHNFISLPIVHRKEIQSLWTMAMLSVVFSATVNSCLHMRWTAYKMDWA